MDGLGTSVAPELGAKSRKHHADDDLRRRLAVHFTISATYGPTDPTRAMLPFLFAASAVQSSDHVTLMLFADAVFMAIEGAGAMLVPVGPPNR